MVSLELSPVRFFENFLSKISFAFIFSFFLGIKLFNEVV
ncbi:MAG: hypothetical protein Greene041614_358 [Parcubacteria group bacterium Greene0416_14]|nr:MAG: hypothetical protein Greene041614_358 [Parcubacteria group bacterium Greene0416_14]TSD01326.1 MAG: hypothetical protein Greene101415_340 [Parcubacteria group bacterium Greene1014_15]TSD08014.1 MAG: hypothetical protein Greene07144_502 [Parcubacteria group bacterium Greene0714_4]